MADVIRFPRGDLAIIRFVVPEILQNDVARIDFMIKRFIWQDDDAAFFSLNTSDNPDVFVASGEPGEYFITIKSEETQEFPLGRHISSIRLVDSDGEVHTLGIAGNGGEEIFNHPFIVEIVTQHDVAV